MVGFLSKTSSKKVICFISLQLIFILLLFPSIDSAFAWRTEYHPTITEHALGVLPEPLKKYFEEVLPSLLMGVEDPDKNRVVSHKYPLYSITGNKISRGEAHIALEEFAKKAEEMVKAGDDKEKIAFVIGQAIHFIQDVNLPLHAVSGEPKEDHFAYEKIAHFEAWPGDKYGYEGFFLVKNYKCYAIDAAKRSSKYAEQALKNPPPPEMIEKTWNDSVNDTANIIQSIFYRALGPEKCKEMYGIPAPKGEKGKGWFCG
jgi:hypothetical protein